MIAEAGAPLSRAWGTAVRLWRLARPAGMPLVLGLPAAGYGFAHWEWAAPEPHLGDLLLLVIVWWFLSAGTLWLNAALDRDDGPVLMGTDPRPGTSEVVARPDRWGYAGLASALLLALPFPPAVWGCVAACAALAVLYSHPATAWKGHPILGPFVNVAGYGVLSPVAGFLLAGLPATPRSLAALALLATWVAGTYFGAQAFQEREDRARGYRTLVATSGPRVVLEVTRAAFGSSVTGMVLLASIGWFPRLLLAVAPGYLWLDAHLAWWVEHPAAGVDAARRMLRRGTALALVVLACALIAHLDAMLHRRPPAGRDTAVRFGEPTVRRYGQVVGRPAPWGE